VDINLEFDSLERLREYVTNISRSGCFMRAEDPLPIGTRLNLRFTVVSAELEIFEGQGEVVRVSEAPRGMGVRFLQLPLASRRIIDDVLSSGRTKRRPAAR
jgi:uncharacterized protein (TIGR02266 family)